jgi:hypothetical protein
MARRAVTVNADRCHPEDVDMNVEGFKLLGMAVEAMRQLEQGNPFAKIAVADFRRALGYADLSEEYLAAMEPLALPLPGVEIVKGDEK